LKGSKKPLLLLKQGVPVTGEVGSTFSDGEIDLKQANSYDHGEEQKPQ